MPNPYGPDHQAHRANWDALIRTGHRPICPRCNQPIEPHQSGNGFDLGHTHDLTLGGNPTNRRPEHTHCNRAAGAPLATQDPPPSRPW